MLKQALNNKGGLKDTNYGVKIGRKGWLEPGDVFNTMNVDAMKMFLNRRNPS
jgi:histidinol phosphatase-like PHP family hydrolase